MESIHKLQFLAPPAHLTNPVDAQIVVLPIPLEQTTSYAKGTINGPEAIIRASTQIEYFDVELRNDPSQKGIFTDWSLTGSDLNTRSLKSVREKICRKACEIISQEKFLLSLGGEHTITVGLVDAFLKHWPDSLTVVQIDAHADLRDQYEDNPLSHACVIRRIWEHVPVIALGIRSLDQTEYELEKPQGYHCVFAHDIHQNSDWIQQTLDKIHTPNVYLTLDLDGLDPSILPSVGTPEPGGLMWYETLAFLRSLANRFNLLGADINELCPGPNPSSNFIAAKLAYKIMGYRFESVRSF